MNELRENIDSVLVRVGVAGVDTVRDIILDAVIAALPEITPPEEDDDPEFNSGWDGAIRIMSDTLRAAKESK